jgi:hypothetical protein
MTTGMLYSCSPKRADLEVELVPPVASRFLSHGNCFSGWYMTTDLLVHDRTRVTAVLDSLSLRVEDAQTGELLGERMVNAVFFRTRFGEFGAVVPGLNSLRIPMSVGALNGSVAAPAISGLIVVTGDVQGHDEQGRVRTTFRTAGAVTVDNRPVPSSGGCAPHS